VFVLHLFTLVSSRHYSNVFTRNRPKRSMLLLAAWLVSVACPQPTRVAVVGGGLAGLGTAANLLLEATVPLTSLDIFDESLPGKGGASAVAAGLLHPFTPRSREIWQGREGYRASVDLLQRVEEVAGPCSNACGLLRLALTAEQASALHAASSIGRVDPEGPGAGDLGILQQEWLSTDTANGYAGALVGGLGAAFAPAALSLDVPSYLRGLWKLCETLSGKRLCGEPVAQWHLQSVQALDQIARSGAYDAIIVALGSRAPTLAGLQGIPLTPCRGQNLVLTNHGGLAKPLISGKYVVPIGSGADKLLAGATFEYDPPHIVHRPPDLRAATKSLHAPLNALYPGLDAEQIVGSQSGVRALPPRSHLGYVPLAGRLGLRRGEEDPDCWLVGGLGSRGLIHHALMGKALARAVLQRDDEQLLPHTRRIQTTLNECDLL
jgi:glycine/D-amino acid oxidase-like deaminating enzyme